jgi:transposase
LVGWSRRARSAQSLALRSKIVLACADGLDNKQVAARRGVVPATVGKWRARFVEKRLNGLFDEPRPGAPRTISDEQIESVIVATLERAPTDATHWSRASMAAETGLSRSTIGRIWREFRLKPHLADTFKLSADPLFIEKSATWSASTWTRRNGRWCCAWTRSTRSFSRSDSCAR